MEYLDAIQIIKQLSATEFNTTIDDINRGRQYRNISDARKAIAMIAKKYYPRISDEKLGKEIGNKDRSTVTTAIQKAKILFQSDKDFRCKVEKIERIANISKEKKFMLFFDTENRRIKAKLENNSIIELEDLNKDELIQSIYKLSRIPGNILH